MPAEILATTVVGSFPQPNWLVDQDALIQAGVPRVRETGIWRIGFDQLTEAQDDATVLAIRAMERAGADIISDGEIRRESYSNQFATALEGIDQANPGEVQSRTPGSRVMVPRVVGPIRRTQAVQVRDAQFLRANTDKRIKVTVPGPFTMAQQAYNDYYPDRESMAMDYAAAVNLEIKSLFEAGADVVQLDEPWLQARHEEARDYGVRVINKALEGVEGTTALHLCFGYAAMIDYKPSGYSDLHQLNATNVDQISIEVAQPNLDLAVLAELPSKTIILGVLDLGDPEVETPEKVASRLRSALTYVSPERLIAAPDCGMKYLPRDVALGKLRALTAGAKIVRQSLT